MWRPMRRSSQQLDHQECINILQESTSGTLACLGDDDYPYAVPLSHVWIDGKLYFHGALTGHRLDAIRRSPKVSYSVVAQDNVIADKLTTFFRSVIVFGRARILDDVTEKRIALFKLGQKFAPGQQEKTIEEIDRFINAVSVVELTVEHMTGKAAVELMAKKD